MKTLLYTTLVALFFLSVGSSALHSAQMAHRESQEGLRSNTASPCPELEFDELPETLNIFFDTKAPNGQQSREAITFRKSDEKNGVLYIPQSVALVLQGSTAQSTQSTSASATPEHPTAPASSTVDANAIAQIKQLREKLAALALTEAAQHTLSTPAIQSTTTNTQSTSSASAVAAPEVTSAPTAVVAESSKAAHALSSKQEEYLAIWTNKLKRSFAIRTVLNSTAPEDEALATRFEAICYEHGLEGKEKSINESIALYEKAAQQGDALSQAYLGINYLLLKRHKEALPLLIAASTKLDDAKIILAYCYRYGIGAAAGKPNSEHEFAVLKTHSVFKNQRAPENPEENRAALQEDLDPIKAALKIEVALQEALDTIEEFEVSINYLHDTIRLGL